MIQPHFFTIGLYSEALRVFKKAVEYLSPFFMWDNFSCRDKRFVQRKWKGRERALLWVVSIETQICTLFTMFLVPTECVIPDRSPSPFQTGHFCSKGSSGCGM